MQRETEKHKMPTPPPNILWLISGLTAALVFAAFAFGWRYAGTISDASQRLTAYGVTFTGAALFVAIITLIGVGFQIRLANEQLGFARRELKVVQDDLAYSERQAEVNMELTRKADLRLAFVDGSAVLMYDFRNSQQALELPFAILNRGKSIKTVLLEIYVGPENMADVGIYGFLPDDYKPWKIEGVLYSRWFRIFEGTVFEGHINDIALADSDKVSTTIPSGEDIMLRYRLVCTDGKFPQLDYGRVYIVRSNK